MIRISVCSAGWLLMGAVLLIAGAPGAVLAADPMDGDIPTWQRLFEESDPADPGRWIYGFVHAVELGDCDTILQRIGEGEAAAEGVAFTVHGMLQESGRCAPVDYGKAADLYRMGMDREDLYAPMALGNLYLRGRGVPRDPEAARHLFRRGVLRLLGTPDEEREEALWLAMGKRTVPVELRRALDWMRELEQGGAAKQLEVAIALWEGDDELPRDRASAVEWLEAVAKAGLPRAQYELAKWINIGRAPAKTPSRANDWMYKAAVAGHAPAQVDLGLRFARGDGIRQDDVAAYAWLLKAQSADADVSEHLLDLRQTMPTHRIEWAQRLAKEEEPPMLFP